MPTLPTAAATERLAEAAENLSPERLQDIWGDLFLSNPPAPPSAAALTAYLRDELTPDEFADFWAVLIPRDRNVWYNEETDEVHFNEELTEAVE